MEIKNAWLKKGLRRLSDFKIDRSKIASLVIKVISEQVVALGIMLITYYKLWGQFDAKYNFVNIKTEGKSKNLPEAPCTLAVLIHPL